MGSKFARSATGSARCASSQAALKLDATDRAKGAARIARLSHLAL